MDLRARTHELTTLGTLDLRGRDGARVHSILAQPRRAALLIYLALARPRGLHQRETLCGLFWGDRDQDSARKALRQALYYLRSSLGEEMITAVGDGEVGVSDLLACDAAEFDEALCDGRVADAMKLYGGELLPGFHVDDALEFERWLETERSWLKSRATHGAWTLADSCEAAGDAAGAAMWGQRAASFLPHDEATMRRLMALLDRTGDRAAAMRAYAQFGVELERELGLTPSAETVDLAARIRGAATHPPGAEPRAPAEVTEAGATPIDSAGASADAPGPLPPVGESAPRPRRLGVRHRGALRARLRRVLLPGALLVSALFIWSLTSNASVSTSPNRLAVFPFRVHGSAELEYLADGLLHMVAAAMDGAGEIRSVHPNTILNALERAGEARPSLEQARGAAREAGAGRFVLGDVVDVGGGHIRVSAALYDTHGDKGPQHEVAEVAALGNLVSLVNEVSRKLLAHAGAGRGNWLSEVHTIRTGSFDALKNFLDGETLLRRGAFDSAGDRFGRAVQIDSTFALSWYRLAMAQGAGYPGDPSVSLRHAADFVDSLTGADRLLVHGEQAFYRGDFSSAQKFFSSTTGAYPDQIEAWYGLGRLRMFFAWRTGGTYSHGLPELEKAHSLDPDHAAITFQLIRIALAERRYDDAAALMPHGPRGAWAAPMMFSFETVLAAVRRGGASIDSLTQMAGVDDDRAFNAGYALAVYSDSVDAAVRLLRQLAGERNRAQQARERARVLLGAALVSAGRFEEAHSELKSLEDSLRLAPQGGVTPRHVRAYRAWFTAWPWLQRTPHELRAMRSELLRSADNDAHEPSLSWPFNLPHELDPFLDAYLVGLLSARLGDTATANAYANVLERAAMPVDSAGLRRDLALEIRAVSEWEQGRNHAALRLLEMQRYGFTDLGYESFDRRMLSRALRGQILLDLGRFDEAYGWLVGLHDPVWTVDFGLYEIARVQVGAILELRREHATAGCEYSRFLRRWQSADAEYLARLRSVRERVARIRQELPVSGSAAQDICRDPAAHPARRRGR